MIRSVVSPAAAALCLLLISGQAAASDHAPTPESEKKAEQAIKEGIERILRALERVMDSIPQYEIPEVLDNGDIIIRRKRPEAKPPEDTDQTRT